MITSTYLTKHEINVNYFVAIWKRSFIDVFENNFLSVLIYSFII